MTSKPACIVALALSLACCMVAPPQAASGSEPETVPRELVEALFIGTGKGKPEILVGKLPENLVSSIAVPAQWRVLGSLVWNGTALIAVTSAEAPPTAQETYARKLSQQTEWRLVGSDNKSDSGSLQPLLFCGPGNAYLVVFATPRESDSSYIRLHYDEGSGHSPCRGAAGDDEDLGADG